MGWHWAGWWSSSAPLIVASVSLFAALILIGVGAQLAVINILFTRPLKFVIARSVAESKTRMDAATTRSMTSED
ncbi:MAG: hypothetical protein FWC58_03265, partial [Desulfobulbus sp.]|nr:hypothetical protein [Desulfobulbus sp.]